MARHPRTIWKPVTITHDIVDTSAPVVAFFTEIRSVDADASQGLQLKRVLTTISAALFATNKDNADGLSCFMGYFKWPADAATPTVSTIDLNNRTKIFARTHLLLQGIQVRQRTLHAKTVRLTLGESLFFFINKSSETSTDVVLHTRGMTTHWETQA